MRNFGVGVIKGKVGGRGWWGGRGRFRTEKESSSPLWQWSLPNDFAKIL